MSKMLFWYHRSIIGLKQHLSAYTTLTILCSFLISQEFYPSKSFHLISVNSSTIIRILFGFIPVFKLTALLMKFQQPFHQIFKVRGFLYKYSILLILKDLRYWDSKLNSHAEFLMTKCWMLFIKTLHWLRQRIFLNVIFKNLLCKDLFWILTMRIISTSKLNSRIDFIIFMLK